MLPIALTRTFTALADTMVPQGGPFPEGATTIDSGAALGVLWPQMQISARRTLIALLLSLDAASLLRTGHRLHRLSADRRLRLCNALETRAPEPLRSAYAGVKTLVLVLVASDNRMQVRMGNDRWPPQLIRR
ncbi:MAG TPA: hypothetical protein VG266_05740 [Candidatus Dormibacteraeota bacterium]|jgi:hypothetical protein|nr:hypothetical protein [Candidatus Dormibacteraeota bacterium]